MFMPTARCIIDQSCTNWDDGDFQVSADSAIKAPYAINAYLRITGSAPLAFMVMATGSGTVRYEHYNECYCDWSHRSFLSSLQA
jgi:formate dehydrogenase maturation protein FdhE